MSSNKIGTFLRGCAMRIYRFHVLRDNANRHRAAAIFVTSVNLSSVLIVPI
jgi:hypothetical protein